VSRAVVAASLAWPMPTLTTHFFPARHGIDHCRKPHEADLAGAVMCKTNAPPKRQAETGPR
jgi:hypothetical protein